jgi:hypothetical protein
LAAHRATDHKHAHKARSCCYCGACVPLLCEEKIKARWQFMDFVKVRRGVRRVQTDAAMRGRSAEPIDFIRMRQRARLDRAGPAGHGRWTGPPIAAEWATSMCNMSGASCARKRSILRRANPGARATIPPSQPRLLLAPVAASTSYRSPAPSMAIADRALLISPRRRRRCYRSPAMESSIGW